MAYTPLPNPWKNIPHVGPLIDAIQNFLATITASLTIRKNNSDIGSQPAINFIEGDNILLDVVNDSGNSEVEVEINVDGTNAVDFADLILRDTYSNIPSAGTEGRLFFATDVGQFYRDNGTSWNALTIDNNGASRVAVDLRAPDATGNVFPTVSTLTAWLNYHWEFLKDVDGKLYGICKIPDNVTVAAQDIILEMIWNATTGVSRMSCKVYPIADAESMNPGSLTSLTAQDVTVPGTARLRKKLTFTDSTNTWVAGDILIIEVFHEGAHANDTVAVNTELLGAWVELS